MTKYILVTSCPERIGIVRSVADFLYELGASIVDSAQYTDIENEKFFSRWEFSPGTKPLPPLDEVNSLFENIANEFSMGWELHDAEIKPRILIAVSKFGHCLNDLLYRWKNEDLPVDIVGVISNHTDFQDTTEWYGLPFYHLPVTPETKIAQEQKILDLIDEMNVDLLVLARYMQILSDNMCQKIDKKAINIHHSFLPSFKGAKPYYQAFDRGVKITGATAHYVTKDLDEGPIIEQEVQRVEHFHDSAFITRLGKSVESLVLLRAIYWHCQHRIVINSNKTVIFK